MRQGELETHLNHGVEEEPPTAATVAVNSPPLQAPRANLVDIDGQPGLQLHGEAHEVAASTSAAAQDPKHARHHAERPQEPTKVSQAFKRCISNSRTRMEINIDYEDTKSDEAGNMQKRI
jgi:hypothetical protein